MCYSTSKKNNKNKMKIFEIFDCNKVLYKLWNDKTELPLGVGFKIYENIKAFNEVENYVFSIMKDLYGDEWVDKLENEKEIGEWYDRLMSTEVSPEVKKIEKETFLENNSIKLSLEDIEKISLILE